MFNTINTGFFVLVNRFLINATLKIVISNTVSNLKSDSNHKTITNRLVAAPTRCQINPLRRHQNKYHILAEKCQHAIFCSYSEKFLYVVFLIFILTNVHSPPEN